MTSEYDRFESIMKKWGYDWEAHQVETEDDYILTTFHILSETAGSQDSESKGTVLIQHGSYNDAASWLSSFQNDDGKPFQLKLVDEGYDVWLGNNRGTEYSRGHKTLDALQDDSYWLFTWAEMGLYDDTANISMIKQKASVDKVYYIGYSQGTI